ncbi:MAG TPA: ATP-grasp domain-containing protein [Longimicrobiales bacterium]|nr:ATP-grasp domain-containing protein [Longimicrobiales bacterium]
MRVTILHTDDAAGPPEDPVLGQLEGALREEGHEVSRVVVADRVPPLVDALCANPPELVFNLAESFGGKSALESNIAALLNLLHLRYTGSSPAGLLLAGDKSIAKKVLGFHGIATPEGATVYRGDLDWAGKLHFPVIVKPPQEDASLGVTAESVVRNLQELLETMSAIGREFSQPVLIEEFIDGREFYVGILGNESPKPLPVMELDFTGFPAGRPRIASFEAKWGDGGAGQGAEFAGTRSIFPEHVDEELLRKMQATAVEAFRALRLRDYARIDLRVTDAGQVYVIEANPNCYLERNAEFARAAERAGLSYRELIHGIVELASARYAR